MSTVPKDVTGIGCKPRGVSRSKVERSVTKSGREIARRWTSKGGAGTGKMSRFSPLTGFEKMSQKVTWHEERFSAIERAEGQTRCHGNGYLIYVDPAWMDWAKMSGLRVGLGPTAHSPDPKAQKDVTARLHASVRGCRACRSEQGFQLFRLDPSRTKAGENAPYSAERTLRADPRMPA